MTPADLLPHRAPMLLIDRIRELAPGRAVAEVEVRASSPFHVAGEGVPAWVALEYIGQTAALIRDGGGDPGDAASGAPATPGYLLGSRALEFTRPWLRVGETLTIECCLAGTVGDALATFDGVVRDADGTSVASGSVSVQRAPADRP